MELVAIISIVVLVDLPSETIQHAATIDYLHYVY